MRLGHTRSTVSPRSHAALGALALVLGCRTPMSASPPAAVLPLPVQPPTICRSHRREITQLVVAAAGDSAITVDLDDVALLWPELDANASPIRLDTKRSLVAHHASFVRVARDRWILTQGGERLDIDATGQVREHGLVAGPAAAAIILGGGTHFAVVRDDSKIDLVRADGRVVHTLQESVVPAAPSFPRVVASADQRTFFVNRNGHDGDVYRLDGDQLVVVSRAADRERFRDGLRNRGMHEFGDPLLSVDGKQLVAFSKESGWRMTAVLEPGRRKDALSWTPYPIDISMSVDTPLGFIAPAVVAFETHGHVSTFDLVAERWAMAELPFVPKILHAGPGVVLGTATNQLAVRRTNEPAHVLGGGAAFSPLWVAVSPSGRRVAWVEPDGRISIDAKNPARMPVTVGTANGPIVLVDDQRLVVATTTEGTSQLVLVDLRSRRPVARRELPMPAETVTYDPMTRVVFVDHRERSLSTRTADTFSRATVGEGAALGPVEIERKDQVTAAPDGLGPFDIRLADGSRLHWDYAHVARFDARGTALWTIRDSKIRQLSASADGSVVAYAAWPGAVVLDGTTGEVLARRCITPSRARRARTTP